jgi:Xaa-Pro aminopeptidase
MPSAAHHASRRQQLRDRVQGPILLLGTTEQPRTLPMASHPFRQDSTFLFFTGCTIPGAAVLLDDTGETLFLPEPGPDDALWHGPTPSLSERAAALGFARVRPARELTEALPAPVRSLAIPDPARNAAFAPHATTPLRFGSAHGDPELVAAVIELRRTKTEEELDALRAAAVVNAKAHIAVQRAVRPGTTERALTALFEGVLAAQGATPGYATILTVRGEVLHNHGHHNTLEPGQLLLIDGGGELASGYTCDITRTMPVSGRYTPRQRAAYDAVLEAQLASIDRCRAGVRYREVHDTTSRILARFLADEGLITCSPDAAVETGAHALFYPHGTGHLLGMDVHDLEVYGDLPAYEPGARRPDQFGTENLRLDLPLEANWVVTVEPGFYVVPAILADASLRERFAGQVDFERAASWAGFGGIRIEDDIVVTSGDPENLTAAVPKAPEAVEALVGTGPSAEERLC